MKLNLIFITIILVLLFFLKTTTITLKQEKDKILFYQKNQTRLENQIRRIYDEKLKIETENQELKKISSKDTFNWHQDISNTLVIKRLQQN